MLCVLLANTGYNNMHDAICVGLSIFYMFFMLFLVRLCRGRLFLQLGLSACPFGARDAGRCLLALPFREAGVAQCPVSVDVVALHWHVDPAETMRHLIEARIAS